MFSLWKDQFVQNWEVFRIYLPFVGLCWLLFQFGKGMAGRTLAIFSATVVVLMGLSTRAATAALLLSRGWAPETPAAVLLSASTSEARSWRGKLSTLGSCDLPLIQPDLPGLLVIGATVSIAERLEMLTAAPPERAFDAHHFV